jgi:catechol 2,3-dioxygenase-like lactoylglutathione lyase family enzyme
MMIPRVRTVFLFVADQDRSLEFYTEKIGMKKMTDAEMWPGARWLEVGAPGAETYLALSAARDFNMQPGEGRAPFTMAVSDVRQFYAELKARGVNVEEPKEERWSTHLRFTDPDGHSIMVSEREAVAEAERE